MKTRMMLVLIAVLTASFVFAQIAAEGFEGASYPPTDWTTLNTTRTTNPQSGTYAATFTAVGNWLRTPMQATPGIMTYWHKKATGNVQFSLQVSTDGTSWTTVTGYPIFAGNGWTQATANLSAYTNVYVRWYQAANNNTWYLDNLGLTAATPTTQASNVNFTNVSFSSLTINWTTGSGTNDVVFVREATAGTPGNAVNGTTYTPSTDWLNKGTQLGTTGYYCVYNGPGTTVSLTNLSPNTAYYVIVYTYNGTGPTSVYRTNGATGNTTTLALTENYFRTIVTGNWNNPAIWEASPNGSNWFPAVGYPTAAAITT